MEKIYRDASEYRDGPEYLDGLDRLEFKYKNGYGASVIPALTRTKTFGRDQHNRKFKGPYEYHSVTFFELAVLDHEGKLCYDTPITNDVLFNLTWAEVEETLKEIQQLEPSTVYGKLLTLRK